MRSGYFTLNNQCIRNGGVSAFPGKSLSDAMDPAWTWKENETVILKPNQTLTVRISDEKQ